MKKFIALFLGVIFLTQLSYGQEQNKRHATYRDSIPTHVRYRWIDYPTVSYYGYLWGKNGYDMDLHEPKMDSCQWFFSLGYRKFKGIWGTPSFRDTSYSFILNEKGEIISLLVEVESTIIGEKELYEFEDSKIHLISDTIGWYSKIEGGKFLLNGVEISAQDSSNFGITYAKMLSKYNSAKNELYLNIQKTLNIARNAYYFKENGYGSFVFIAGEDTLDVWNNALGIPSLSFEKRSRFGGASVGCCFYDSGWYNTEVTLYKTSYNNGMYDVEKTINKMIGNLPAKLYDTGVKNLVRKVF